MPESRREERAPSATPARSWISLVLLWVAPAVSAGLVFAVLVNRMGPDALSAADDGVITMSHARNVVEYGSISINPSGERIDGQSSPLQLAFYTAAYALTGADYESLSVIHTVFSLLAMGALFGLLAGGGWVQRSLAAAAAAALFGQSHTALGWTVSGMENGLVHVALLAAVLVLGRVLERPQGAWLAVVVTFFASIARAEAILYVAPLLVALVIHGRVLHGRWDGVASRVAAGTMALWLAYMLAHHGYFSDFLPNTAAAQQISIRDQLAAILHLDLPVLTSTWDGAVRPAFLKNGGALLALCLPLLLVARPAGARAFVPLACLLIAVVAALHPFFFGRARLDPGRTTTVLAVATVMGIASLTTAIPKPWLRIGVAVPLLALAVYLGTLTLPQPYRIGWSARGILPQLEEVDRVASGLGFRRPTVSTPDLGVLSFRKNYNVVDVGFIGSPVLARLSEPDDLRRYFLDFAAPDVYENHARWRRRLEHLHRDPRFDATYAGIGEIRRSAGLWVRRAIRPGADTPERHLIDDLEGGIDVGRIEAEIARCLAAGSDRLRCVYVTRSVYRLLPEIRQAGMSSAVLQLFERTPTRRYDLALLGGKHRGSWWRDVIAEVRESAPPS